MLDYYFFSIYQIIFWSFFPYHSGLLQWASYQIRKIAGCACAGNAGNVFPRRQFQTKPLFSDPGMHHGTCVTHVPWCMSGSRTRDDGENVPGIPGACAPAILRIWQEAHDSVVNVWSHDCPSPSRPSNPAKPCVNILHVYSLSLNYHSKSKHNKTIYIFYVTVKQLM